MHIYVHCLRPFLEDICFLDKHAAILLARSHSFVSSLTCFQEKLILAEVMVRSHTFKVVNFYAPANTLEHLSMFRSFEDHSTLFDPLLVAF